MFCLSIYSTLCHFIVIPIKVLLALIIGSFCIAFVLEWGLNWLAMIPWRRSVGKHWTERARLLYPARKSARFNLWILTVFSVIATLLLDPESNPIFPALAGLLGAVLGSYSMNREIYPEIRFKSWLHLVASSLLLLFGFWAVLVTGALAMPENFGPLTWVVAGLVLLAMVAYFSGLGVHLLRGLRLLKPAPQQLAALVEEVSQKMAVPVRATWVLSTHLNNAVALPLTRQLIFTEKLVSIHPAPEIKVICAHELGHLNEPRKVLFVRTLVGLSLFPLVFIKPMDSFATAPDGYLLLLIPILLLFLVGRRVSRRMEKRADQIAAENQADTTVYARALERLYQTNHMPAVTSGRSNKIHPDLYDRVLAAGVTPEFPKPAPARGLSWTSYLLLAALVVFPSVIGFLKIIFAVWDGVRMNFN